MNSDILSLGIIVTTIIVIPIYKNLLEVYPIFNLQTRYSFKVLNVACYKGYVLFKSSGCNEHVHIANAKTLFFKSPAYFSVFAHILYGIMLKKFGNFRNIVEDTTVDGLHLVVKKFKKPTEANRVVYSFLRPSKAKRAYNYSNRLLQMGFDVPEPVAYMEVNKGLFFHTGYFLCLYTDYRAIADFRDNPEIAEEEGYIPNESDEELQEQEAIEASEKFNSYIQKHSQEIFIISPDSEKRPDDLNNALNMVDTEMLLYFPDEDVLTSEEGARLEIEDYVGDQLMKYGFAIDPRQTEIQVFNVPYQMRYIVRKETENSVDELFPE